MKYLPDEWIRSFPNPTHIDREHRGLRLASVTLTVTRLRLASVTLKPRPVAGPCVDTVPVQQIGELPVYLKLPGSTADGTPHC
jgi:hypothetical protein